MLIIDFEATNARIKDRCVMPAKVARKFGINATSMSKFLQGRFYGCSGQGVLGQLEKALIDMDLLVYSVAEEEPKPWAA